MILVATPTRGEVLATFTQDLINLLGRTKDTVWFPALGTYITNNRTLLVHKAGELKASHILFIDSDMRFPADTLDRLLAHDKDIVGANYRQRTRDEWCVRKNNQWVSSTDKKGLEEVDTMGFGVILLKMEMFLSKLRPLPLDVFAMPPDPQTGMFFGEDYNFCLQAKKIGYKIWVDHDLSQEVKHTGMVEL